MVSRYCTAWKTSFVGFDLYMCFLYIDKALVEQIYITMDCVKRCRFIYSWSNYFYFCYYIHVVCSTWLNSSCTIILRCLCVRWFAHHGNVYILQLICVLVRYIVSTLIL